MNVFIDNSYFSFFYNDMLGFFKRRDDNRVEIIYNSIFIDNRNKNIGKSIEIEKVFELLKDIPEIEVFENGELTRVFKIETLKNNPRLAGQFLHSSIRILPNSAVIIDGIISNKNKAFPNWQEQNYEGIRLQPFYLSNANDYNLKLIGKGLFERGLHFSGIITPSGVRSVCICDKCNLSFTIQHFHAGFAELQYFYSSDSKETLIVPYNAIANLPMQLQENIEDDILSIIEEKLPKPSNYNGLFKYYNSFNCPHCLTPYIDFNNDKDSRPKEYYGNTYINEKPLEWINAI